MSSRRSWTPRSTRTATTTAPSPVSSSTAADGLPALGIVAAVLGVIHTMGAITEPPEVLGHLIGAALVGTFSGVLAAYGFVAPIGKALEARLGADEHVLEATKTALVAHTQGYAPQISVEFARKTIATKLQTDVRRARREAEHDPGLRPTI